MNIKSHKVMKYGEFAAPSDVPDAELLELESEEDELELVSEEELEHDSENGEAVDEAGEELEWESASDDEEEENEEEGSWKDVSDEENETLDIQSPVKKQKLGLASQKVIFLLIFRSLPTKTLQKLGKEKNKKMLKKWLALGVGSINWILTKTRKRFNLC
jgi:hypothetical protein